MKCIYCNATLKNGALYCPKCGKEAQLVSDDALLEDELLRGLMAEKQAKEAQLNKSAKKNAKKNTSPAVPDEPAAAGNKRLIVVTVLVVCFVIAIMCAIIGFIVWNQNHNSLTYQMSKAQSAADAGHDARAISYYERAIEIDHSNVDARIALGDIYLSRKEYDSAQLYYQEAVNLDDTAVDAYKGLIRVFEEQDKYDQLSLLNKTVTDETVLDMLRDYLVEPPAFSKLGGEYDTNLVVTLSGADDCRILYTTDGKDPVTYGEEYEEPFTFETDGNYTISAVSINEKGITSAVVTEEYVITIAAPDMPVVNPDGGNFGAPTSVAILVPQGCSAYYKWDDTATDPNITDHTYNGPFEVPEGSHVLSVIIVDNRTEKVSPVYRSNYTFYQ